MGQQLAAMLVQPDEDEIKCFPFISKKYDVMSTKPMPKDRKLIEERPSKLSPGIKTRSIVGMGIFASEDIPVDTLVCGFNPLANDCAIDLSKVINALTAQEVFDGLVECREKYYNYSDVEKEVNVCVVKPPEEIPHLISLRFIAKGEEIKRIYGFSTWLKELPEINVLNCITARGVLDYIVKVQTQKVHDHYYQYCAMIASRHKEIIAVLDECEDQTMKVCWRFGGPETDPTINITFSPANSPTIDSNTILPHTKTILLF